MVEFRPLGNHNFIIDIQAQNNTQVDFRWLSMDNNIHVFDNQPYVAS